MTFHRPYYPRTVIAHLYLNVLAASFLTPRHIRKWLYRLWGADIQTIRVSHSCQIGGRQLSIGEDSFINYGCRFDTSAQISIGRDVFVAEGVRFVTSTHTLGPPSRRAGHCTAKPIVVGNGCWIGTGAIILPGAVIGNGCVIAAGSVVKENFICEPNYLYAGVPAVWKKAL